MPTILTTIEIPIELEYGSEPVERGARDEWGAPTEPDQVAAQELLSATVLAPALEARAPAWRRTPPRCAGWYWLRRAGGEAIIRRIVEVPMVVQPKTGRPAELAPKAVSVGRSRGAENQELLPTGLVAVVASRQPSPNDLETCLETPRFRTLPPPTTVLIVLEPGEGPRSSLHVPVSAYSQVWQWAGPIPVPGAALPISLEISKLDVAVREGFDAEISETDCS